MKIDISLNTKSIDNAIKQLKSLQKQIPNMTQVYMQKCCEWIKQRANIYLQSSGVGDNVITDIMSSCEIISNGTFYTLKYGEKAAYIEFGVGIVGQGTYQFSLNPSLQGEWEYNVDSGKKNSDGSWSFVANVDSTIDIKNENIISIRNIGHAGAVQRITTKGNQATSFVYQSAMDFKSSGAYLELWQQVKKEYIK